MKRSSVLAAIAVVVAANAVALWSAAANRAGVPEARVEVTQRDVAVEPLGDENTGLAMRFTGSWRRGAYALGEAKLKQLGFDVQRRRVPQKEAFVALDNTDERGLMAVDVAADPQVLRRRYPDRRRVIIARCVVSMIHFAGQAPTGIIPTLLVSELHVPRPFSASLAGARRYTVALCYGRNYEPWICGYSPGPPPSAGPPSAEIANGPIRARIYLPDAETGFYRGTRFDWSGVIYHLEYKGHNFYGPWFNKTAPEIHDFIYSGPDIVAGPCSATTGPADEFGPIGYEEARPGGTFVKIGVGNLRKPDDNPYDHFRLYEIADPGRWTVRRHADSIEFTQELAGVYTYRKTVRLVKGKPEMVLEHSLKNTGSQPIRTSVYNHNFLVLDARPPGPGLVITVPFHIQSPHPPNQELAAIRGNRIVYLKTLQGRDVVTTPVGGFGSGVQDNDIRIDDSRAHAGMTIRGDRPLSELSLWSIRTVVAMEPYIAIAVEPGQEFTWKITYDYR